MIPSFFAGCLSRRAACLAGLVWALCAAAVPAQEAVPPPRATPAADTLAAGSGTVLGADDLIEVKVFGEDDLTTSTRISADGTISFPLLGVVRLAGKTASQGAQVLRDRLQERFLVNPQVSLVVVENARRLFTVLGQVARPGTYRFPGREPLNLVQAIGVAGGYTRLADPSRITLRRVAGGKETILRLDAKRMARDGEMQIPAVRPGDIITVNERLF
jgi:protein involved in polysaccharide export with SLBB domain